MDQADKLRRMVKQQAMQNRTAKVITVTSGKGGVGKSNVSVNLAIAMSRAGKKVIIFDADFGLANVEIMLGIRPQYSLADLMYKGKTLTEVITRGPENIGFISGGSGIQELNNLTKDQIILLLQKLVELDKMADVIIIDTGAGITDTVIEFVVASSEVILVATPEPTSITDAYALMKTLNCNAEFCLENRAIKMVSNNVHTQAQGRELYNKLSVVVGKYLNINLEYLGALPHDNAVSKSVMQQKPVVTLYPNSQFAKEIEQFARILSQDEEKTEEQQNKKGIALLFSNLINARKKTKIE